jgi:predicted amidohydrolase
VISSAGTIRYGTAKVCRSPKEEEDIVEGTSLAVFTGTPLGRIGVLICYDVYELRNTLLGMADAAVDILYIPSVNRTNAYSDF